MIVRDKPFSSLRADRSDRFDGEKHLYPNKRPITRLRLVGVQGGQWFYAPADDIDAVLPEPPAASPAIGVRLGGKKL